MIEIKNIFAYIGSHKGNQSNTYKLTKEILDAVVKRDNNISYELIMANDVNIERCKGCNNCFNTVTCPLDNKDDMKVIKRKMIESDFIILGSPVYAHNVSGDMKIFIDRLSHWMHLITLSGKGGMSLSTTASNGHGYAVDYLNKIMNYWGLNMVGKLNASFSYPDELFNDEWLDNKTEEYSEIIIDTLSALPKTNPNLEQIFKGLKTTMLYYEEQNIQKGEFMFWRNVGFLEHETFSDLLKELENNKILDALGV